MTPHDDQVEPIAFLVKHQRALIHAPAGSGKTVIGAIAVTTALPMDTKAKGVLGDVIWIANTIEQVTQAEKALSLALGYEAKRRVKICDWQSFPDVSRASIIVIDEAQHASAPVLNSIVEQAPKDCRIWGLTATPWKEDEEHNQVIREIFYNFHQVEREALVRAGRLCKARVIMLSVDKPNEFQVEIERVSGPEIENRCNRLRFLKSNEAYYKAKCAEARQRVLWQSALKIGVLLNRKRNSKAVEVATEHVLNDDSVLVLVNQVVHAQSLAEKIPGAVAVFAAIGAKKRKTALEGFASGSVPCVVATSLADEGLDVPRANVLVLVSAGRSASKLEQRTGRVLRSFAGKTHGVIYDFEDEGFYFLKAQSQARQRVYRKLGYEFQDHLPSTSQDISPKARA